MADDTHKSRRVESVDCAVITVSDTRTEENDESGTLIRERLASQAHVVSAHMIIPDDSIRVAAAVEAYCADRTTQAVILTGGTGLSPRDSTYEAVAGLLDKTLDGFGELFRMLSYEDVGAAAMLSRAVAGVRQGTVVFALPGSVAAVRLAMDKLVLSELGHIAALLRDPS